MVLLKIVATIELNKMVEFEQAVDYILQTDKSNPANCSKSIYRDWRHHNVLLYFEEWQSIEDLKKHVTDDHFKSLLGAIKVLGEINESHIISSGSVQALEKFME